MMDARKDATIEAGSVYDLAFDPSNHSSTLSPSDVASFGDSTTLRTTETPPVSETDRLLPEWAGPTISGAAGAADKAEDVQLGIHGPLNAASKILIPIGWGDNAYRVGQHLAKGDLREASSEALGVGGSVGGALAGAAIGFKVGTAFGGPAGGVAGAATGAYFGSDAGDRLLKSILPPPPPDALPTTDDLAPTIDTGEDVYILVRTSGEGAEDTFAWYFDTQRSAFYEQHPTIWDGRCLKVSDTRAAELTDQYLQVALTGIPVPFPVYRQHG